MDGGRSAICLVVTDLSMQHSSPHAAMPDRRLSAWVGSIALHGGALVLLCIATQQAPRGGTLDEPDRSAGIVLRRSSAEGDVYEGEEERGDQSDSPRVPLLPPPELAAVVPEEFSPVVVGHQVPQVTPTAGPGAMGEKASASGGALANQAGLRGSPAGQDYAKVSVFGVEGAGNKFVYVFDRSSSMEGPPLAAAKRQLIDSLESLDTVHQFHIIFFNHRLRSMDLPGGGRRIAFGTERSKKLAARFVGGITADGGTDRFAALKQALAIRPDVVFFLTDADDPMSASEMKDIERINERIGAAICVIEFGRTAARPKQNFLTELAGQSGGQYGYVNTTKLKP